MASSSAMESKHTIPGSPGTGVTQRLFSCWRKASLMTHVALQRTPSRGRLGHSLGHPILPAVRNARNLLDLLEVASHLHKYVLHQLDQPLLRFLALALLILQLALHLEAHLLEHGQHGGLRVLAEPSLCIDGVTDLVELRLDPSHQLLALLHSKLAGLVYVSVKVANLLANLFGVLL